MRKLTLNDFTYVYTKFFGLKTTIIHHKNDLFEIRKEYVCSQCKKEKEVIMYKHNVTSKEQTDFHHKASIEQMCPLCYTKHLTENTAVIESVADSIMMLFERPL